LALAFTGVSSREDIARIRALIASHGEAWPEAWLGARGVDPALFTQDKEAGHAA